MWPKDTYWSLTDCALKTALILGIGERTVQRINKENEELSSPQKRGPKLNFKDKYEEFVFAAIRRKVHKFSTEMSPYSSQGILSKMQVNKNLPPTEDSKEPLELHSLKKLLENLHCACAFCEKYIKVSTKQQPIQQKDQEVQETLKPDVAVASNQTAAEYIHTYPTTDRSSFYNDQVCPSCMIGLRFLKNGATLVLKDEEIEAKPETLCQSTNEIVTKMVEGLDKTTSYVKPVLKNPVRSLIVTTTAITSQESFHSTNNVYREVTFARNNKYYGYDDINQSPTKHSEFASDRLSTETETEDENASTPWDNTELEETESFCGFTNLQAITPMSYHCVECIDVHQYINSIRPSDGPPFL